MKRSLSFGTYLFLSVITVYFVFVLSFLYYQYHREKTHKVELLESTLVMFNVDLCGHLADSAFSMHDYVDLYRHRHHLKELRVTLIDSNGKVMFDNDISSDSVKTNHLEREEIRKARATGNGYSLKRTSETLGRQFFYSATYFPEYGLYVRSALPYDTDLLELLNADRGYLWFAFLLSAILCLVFYHLTARLGEMITHLKNFARRADHDEPVDADETGRFGNHDLGQISRHIIDIYTRLRKTRDDLFREREKLIAHLQISDEGLAIFNPGHEVILSNTLFMQYLNLISDKNVSTVDEVFQVKELQPLFAYLSSGKEDFQDKKVESKMIIVDKNGYIFRLSIALFGDRSFEISISNITEQEEQARMKQQITQNIAHELKTPVSSIQGYLETILNTPDLSDELLHKFIERCYAQSNRLTNLLQDISTLTRMTEAGHLMEVTETDLVPIIRNIEKDLAMKLNERQMDMSVSLPDTLKMEGNPSLLDSIFRNLTDNAIAYAGVGTHVRVVCYSEDEENFYFSFSDDGAGVAPEHLGRLFERFYRVDKGRSRKLGGTGLGLAIVKNAVLFHGGTIHAKPANGHGLEFLFTLKKMHPRHS